jgi:hypothetical protein
VLPIFVATRNFLFILIFRCSRALHGTSPFYDTPGHPKCAKISKMITECKTLFDYTCIVYLLHLVSDFLPPMIFIFSMIIFNNTRLQFFLHHVNWQLNLLILQYNYYCVAIYCRLYLCKIFIYQLFNSCLFQI